MFDWKILAASFAALLVVSSVLVGGFGFSDILDRLSDFLGDSPLGGFVTAPVRGSSQVTVTFRPRAFEFSLDGADFDSGGASFQGFSGTVNANLTSGELAFREEGGLRVSLPLEETAFEGVSIGRITLEDTSFHVISNSLDTSGQNATLEVLDFSGTLTLTPREVRLHGNVTSVVGNGKEIV